MPNWCLNGFLIKGPKKEIDQLISFLTTEDRVYYANGEQIHSDLVPYHSKEYTLVPLIEQTREEYAISMLQPGRHNDIEHYFNETFGSDCNEWIDVHRESPTELNISIPTAWVPISKVPLLIAKRFPKLNIEMVYDEEGDAFAGRIKCENGVQIEHINVNDDGYREFVNAYVDPERYEYQCTNSECMALFGDFDDEVMDEFKCSICGREITEKG